MPSLEAVLWKLYERGDPRISLLSSFQSDIYTYVKIVINDGEHDIVVEEITDSGFKFTIQRAFDKAIVIITERALVSMRADLLMEFSNDPVY